MSTETIADTEILTIPYEETDDGNEHLAHIINPAMNTHIWQPGMSAKEIVMIARMTNQQVTALCGYRWAPKRNPERYDTCHPCVHIASELSGGL